MISPFYKDGTHNDPNIYRGICISSALLKIICTFLDNRIQEFCTKKEIINKNQIGFKRNHRTSDQLLTLKAIVKKYVSIGKKKLFTCFVDLKKAFVDLKKAFVDLKKAFVDLKKAFVDLKKAFVDLKKAFDSVLFCSVGEIV